jgi:hypothetical protein
MCLIWQWLTALNGLLSTGCRPLGQAGRYIAPEIPFPPGDVSQGLSHLFYLILRE